MYSASQMNSLHSTFSLTDAQNLFPPTIPAEAASPTASCWPKQLKWQALHDSARCKTDVSLCACTDSHLALAPAVLLTPAKSRKSLHFHSAMANIPEGTILAIENTPGTFTQTTTGQANAAQALVKASAPPPTYSSCGGGCDQCHNAPCIRHKQGHLWHCCFACRDSWAVQQARSRYW